MASSFVTIATTAEEQLTETLYKIFDLQQGANSAVTNPDGAIIINNLSVGPDGTLSFSGTISTTGTAPAGKPTYDPIEVFVDAV